VVESGGLENRCTARYRGFEFYFFRHFCGGGGRRGRSEPEDWPAGGFDKSGLLYVLITEQRSMAGIPFNCARPG
jgi:hypothetical protein